MKLKKIVGIILLLFGIGVFLFWSNLVALYSELLGEFTVLQKEITLPGPLRSVQDSYNAFLTREGIIQWTNIQRQRNGLSSLTENRELDNSALLKVQDMLDKQYFEHVSPSGASVSDLAERTGYDFISIGENLALGNFKNDEVLVQAWMDSPGHRANILNTKYRDIGIAVIKGQFQGRTVWLAVQHFGLLTTVCPAVDSILKQSIDERDRELEALRQQLDTRRADLDNTKPKHGDVYNQKVEAYNVAVKEYNRLLDQQKSQISQYNSQVNAVNSCYQSYK